MAMQGHSATPPTQFTHTGDVHVLQCHVVNFFLQATETMHFQGVNDKLHDQFKLNSHFSFVASEMIKTIKLVRCFEFGFDQVVFTPVNCPEE